MTDRHFRTPAAGRGPDHRMSMRDLGILADGSSPSSRSTTAISRGGVRLRRPRAAEPVQPQPAAGARDRGGRPEDRPHQPRPATVWWALPSRATAGSSSCHRARQRRGPRRRSRRSVELGVPPVRTADRCGRGTSWPQAEVWMGSAEPCRAGRGRGLSLLVPALVRGDIEAEVVYRGPLTAPIAPATPSPSWSSPCRGTAGNAPAARRRARRRRGGFLTRVRTAARASDQRVTTETAGPDPLLMPRWAVHHLRRHRRSGKSTQVRRLADALRARGRDVWS